MRASRSVTRNSRGTGLDSLSPEPHHCSNVPEAGFVRACRRGTHPSRSAVQDPLERIVNCHKTGEHLGSLSTLPPRRGLMTVLRSEVSPGGSPSCARLYPTVASPFGPTYWSILLIRRRHELATGLQRSSTLTTTIMKSDSPSIRDDLRHAQSDDGCTHRGAILVAEPNRVAAGPARILGP